MAYPDWLWPLLAVVLVLLLVGVGLFYRRPLPSLPDETPEAVAPPASLPDRWVAALARTRSALGESLRGLFGSTPVDDATWTALEEALLRADVGARATGRLLEELKSTVPSGASGETLRTALKRLLVERISIGERSIALSGELPRVILMVGVNGSGKTTTIGKLAGQLQKSGRSVILGAGDTFRAGAIEQLKVWGERAGVTVIAHQEGADPAAVLHDTVSAAKARNIDIAICDTAGRLQAHKALMDELGKVRRVIGKVLPGAPHEVLLVLDATMGQNALSQARTFKEVAGVTGVVLTKLDGTAKGGIVVAIAEEMGLPVKLVGVGEKMEDLRPFEPAAFVEALF